MVRGRGIRAHGSGCPGLPAAQSRRRPVLPHRRRAQAREARRSGALVAARHARGRLHAAACAPPEVRLGLSRAQYQRISPAARPRLRRLHLGRRGDPRHRRQIPTKAYLALALFAALHRVHAYGAAAFRARAPDRERRVRPTRRQGLAQARLGGGRAPREQSRADQHLPHAAGRGLREKRRAFRRTQPAREPAGAGLLEIRRCHRRNLLRRRRARLRREQSLPAAGNRLLRAPGAQALARGVDPAERRLRRRPQAGLHRRSLRRRPVRPRDDHLITSTAPTRDSLAGKLPVSLITGFLGSGKTTLLRRLLRDPGMNRAAVIINEFGEVGIDHELVASSSESETLRELFIKRRAGEVIDFDRVFIETTGLADPVPVLHTLQTDAMLGAQYRLDCVVTLVDAVNGLENLDDMPEAAKQAAVADRIVITKSDIARPGAVAALEARLERMNPYAARSVAVNGELDVAFLRDVGPRSTRATPKDLERWLAPSGEARAEGAYLGERVRAGAHDASIRSFCLWFEKPFTWDTFSAAVQVLTSLRGSDLLRVKGLVNVAGESGPVVVQGAQHVFHTPVTLDAWSGEDRRSRIVFITRNLSRESVEALFAAVGTLAAPRN